MQVELSYLTTFLLVSLGIAPLMTNTLFLARNALYFKCYVLSFSAVALGILLNINFLVATWPAFCLFGLLLYLKKTGLKCLDLNAFVSVIPFVFSVIASIWLVAGVYDIRLLGYNKLWSFYAALHGNHLGWLLVGCLAYLAQRRTSRFYVYACYICFVSFLLIALGIDGVPYIKQIGVIFMTVTVPCSILFYFLKLKGEQKIPKVLSGLSLFGVLVTMLLAVVKEFGGFSPFQFMGAGGMVSIHGLINSLIVTPCFFIAVLKSDG